MSVRIKVLGKEYPVAETIKNVKKTFKMQKAFVALSKDIDGEDPMKAIDASVELVDKMAEYVADMVGDKAVTVEKIQDKMEYLELVELTKDVTNGVLHIEEYEAEETTEEVAEAKK